MELTSNYAHEVWIVYIDTNSTTRTVSSVTSSDLTWHLRTDNHTVSLYVYWATATSALTKEVITVALSTSAITGLGGFTIKGASWSATPFDVVSAATASGTSAHPGVNITTTSRNDYIFGILDATSNKIVNKVNPFTLIQTQNWGANPRTAASEGYSATTVQTKLQVNFTLSLSESWNIIADAVQFVYPTNTQTAQQEWEWYAITNSTLTKDNITMNWPGSASSLTISAFGISGANTSSPFDSNAAANSHNSTGSASFIGLNNMTTSQKKDLLLGFGSFTTKPTITGTPGFTVFLTKNLSGPSVALEDELVTKTVSNLAVNFSLSSGAATNVMLTDAVKETTNTTLTLSLQADLQTTVVNPFGSSNLTSLNSFSVTYTDWKGSPGLDTVYDSTTVLVVKNASTVTITGKTSGSSASDETCLQAKNAVCPASVTFNPSGPFVTQTYYYYEMIRYNFSYSVTGGGSPSAPTLRYQTAPSVASSSDVHNWTTATLTGSYQSVYALKYSQWNSTNPLGTSTSSNRWFASSPKNVIFGVVGGGNDSGLNSTGYLTASQITGLNDINAIAENFANSQNSYSNIVNASDWRYSVGTITYTGPNGTTLAQWSSNVSAIIASYPMVRNWQLLIEPQTKGTGYCQTGIYVACTAAQYGAMYSLFYNDVHSANNSNLALCGGGDNIGSGSPSQDRANMVWLYEVIQNTTGLPAGAPIGGCDGVVYHPYTACRNTPTNNLPNATIVSCNSNYNHSTLQGLFPVALNSTTTQGQYLSMQMDYMAKITDDRPQWFTELGGPFSCKSQACNNMTLAMHDLVDPVLLSKPYVYQPSWWCTFTSNGNGQYCDLWKGTAYGALSSNPLGNWTVWVDRIGGLVNVTSQQYNIVYQRQVFVTDGTGANSASVPLSSLHLTVIKNGIATNCMYSTWADYGTSVTVQGLFYPNSFGAGKLYTYTYTAGFYRPTSIFMPTGTAGLAIATNTTASTFNWASALAGTKYELNFTSSGTMANVQVFYNTTIQSTFPYFSNGFGDNSLLTTTNSSVGGNRLIMTNTTHTLLSFIFIPTPVGKVTVTVLLTEINGDRLLNSTNYLVVSYTYNGGPQSVHDSTGVVFSADASTVISITGNGTQSTSTTVRWCLSSCLGQSATLTTAASQTFTFDYWIQYNVGLSYSFAPNVALVSTIPYANYTQFSVVQPFNTLTVPSVFYWIDNQSIVHPQSPLFGNLQVVTPTPLAPVVASATAINFLYANSGTSGNNAPLCNTRNTTLLWGNGCIAPAIFYTFGNSITDPGVYALGLLLPVGIISYRRTKDALLTFGVLGITAGAVEAATSSLPQYASSIILFIGAGVVAASVIRLIRKESF
jgi:hypothetical protein